MSYENEMIELMDSPKQPEPQGQEIWKIAQRSNAKPGRLTSKQVKSYKRVGLL